jgi:hypothetical protein
MISKPLQSGKPGQAPTGSRTMKPPIPHLPTGPWSGWGEGPTPEHRVVVEATKGDRG